MPALTRQEVLHLIDLAGELKVSLYMPVHRAGPETRQDPILLKNLIKDAEDQIEAYYAEQTSPEALMEKPKALVEDHDFWQHQMDGLALFCTPETFLIYRLPLIFEPLATVGERFKLSPLLPLLSRDGIYYLLAISLNDTRLYQGNRLGISEVELEDTPLSIEEALRFDDPEATLQWHTGTQSTQGERRGMFFGQGLPEADQIEDIRRFFHKLSDGVENELAGENAPLVLAGVDFLMPYYQEINQYPHLVDETISGSPEGMSVEGLQHAAWEILEPLFAQEIEQAVERFQNLKSTQNASSSLNEIIPAAVAGRVDTLFVRKGIQIWGSYKAMTHSIDMHDERQPGDEDLLALAVTRTISQNGRVYQLNPANQPENAPASAIFRYTM